MTAGPGNGGGPGPERGLACGHVQRSGQAGYMSPSPTLAPPTPGRLPSSERKPGRGCRSRQTPPLMPALPAPRTARSSHAPCARRPSAGGWSCGCTWCRTRGRCPTRSGSRLRRASQGCGGEGAQAPVPCWPSCLSPCPPSMDSESVHRVTGQHLTSRLYSGLVPFHGGQALHPCGRPHRVLLGLGLCGDLGSVCSAPPAPSSSCRRKTCRAT